MKDEPDAEGMEEKGMMGIGTGSWFVCLGGICVCVCMCVEGRG